MYICHCAHITGKRDKLKGTNGFLGNSAVYSVNLCAFPSFSATVCAEKKLQVWGGGERGKNQRKSAKETDGKAAKCQ